MRKIGQMIGTAVGREELTRILKARVVLRGWSTIVGPMLAERSHPDKYDHGTVWVAVEGSAWAQELRMSKESILRRLRERAADPGLFSDIRFGVRPLPKPEAEIEPGKPQLPKPTGSIREIAEQRLREWPDAGGA